MTELLIENLVIPGAPLGAENPLPFFRDPAINRYVRVTDTMPLAKQEYLGWETAFRVLPYRMQDQYTRRREPLTFRSIVLENETLRATFLPEIGGRLISLFHKPLQRELLHRNPVFQPANLAIRNAWFSGGIEWNIGQVGHTFTTCSPLFASAIEGVLGEPGLRIYEYERCKSLFWQIDFYLPPGFPFLVAYTRVVNPNPVETSMYWWTNIAVNEAPDVRVLAPASHVIYIDFTDQGSAFGYTCLPGLPSLKGMDGTYSMNFPFANEFFFQCEQADMPWEAALDRRGCGLIEASTRRLKYRKMFCWGNHKGGRHWQQFLSQPGQAYVEIQAGLAPTQVHGLVMPAHTSWDWTQVFGYLEADPTAVHSADWERAIGTVEAELEAKLSIKKLYDIEKTARSRADYASRVILQVGSGWGALELRRRKMDPDALPVSDAFVFPDSCLGPEQGKWLHLLEGGALPDQYPAQPPGEWMTAGIAGSQTDWRNQLERSVDEGGGRNWFSLLHLGVMRLEALDEESAAAAWEQSLQITPSAIVHRNLAVLRLRQKKGTEALQHYINAWELTSPDDGIRPALAVEVLQTLVNMGQYARSLEFLRSLPNHILETDPIQLLWAQIALELGLFDQVDGILEREYAVIQEGQTLLTDLWFELQARKVSAQTGEALTEALRQKIKQTSIPPARIDFRSHNNA